MKKLSLIVSALVLSIGAAGCQQDTKNTDRKLDELAKAVAALDAKVTAMGGAGAGRPGQQPGQQRQQPPKPDPKDVFSVPVDRDPSDGPVDALVTIVKGYEYACPYCEKVRPTLDQLKKDYGDKIRIVPKQYVVHPDAATLPALAFCASHKQGKAKEYDNLLWEKAYGARKFDQANMEALATELKLDLAKFKADMAGECGKYIQDDQAELRAVGQTGTPAFYINGRFLSGAQPLPAFKAVIDEEIKKAEERIAQGTAKASYYKTWVVEKGLKKFVPKPQ
jgi:protein-disulfide isomerase